MVRKCVPTQPRKAVVTMARNKYAGYCYSCGTFVPVGYGHFERRKDKSGNRWQIKCVKCASGRI